MYAHTHRHYFFIILRALSNFHGFLNSLLEHAPPEARKSFSYLRVALFFRDISRRVFISRFSAPSTSIHEFLPVSVFSWPSNSSTFMQTDQVEHVDKVISATKLWFSEHLENNSFLPSEEEDIALWLLVSTISGSDTQHHHISNNSCPSNPVRFWRLALLVKNVMVLGGLLDSRYCRVIFFKFQAEICILKLQGRKVSTINKMKVVYGF